MVTRRILCAFLPIYDPFVMYRDGIPGISAAEPLDWETRNQTFPHLKPTAHDSMQTMRMLWHQSRLDSSGMASICML